MFVTPQCLIAGIWVNVACHDTYQSDLTELTLNFMQLHCHTQKTITWSFIIESEISSDFAAANEKGVTDGETDKINHS